MRDHARLKEFGLWLAVAVLLAGSALSAALENEPEELTIVQNWRGDYPVSLLNKLPEGRRNSRVGYLGDPVQFTEVWQAFKPGEKVPEVEFRNYVVVFSRNVTFYNRIGIAKVLLRDGSAEVLVMETMSALPIEDTVAMAMAVIPRAGVRYIEAGSERIPVEAGNHSTPSDSLNTTYTIEGREIRLQKGRSEVAIGAGSATKIRTVVFGEAAFGDLDGDGDDDAALILVHDPGGSGTFYYVAAALNLNGRYRGTNAVLLGDRIAPKDLQIRNGVVIAAYAKRGFYEPMSVAPSVEAQLSLTFDEGKLKALSPLGADEQILEGLVIIGHEVRSFAPCSQKVPYWLSGDSPALGDIVARYKEALPDARPYTPLFMVLAGIFIEAPRHGFGADYEAAFLATELVAVRPEGNYLSDSMGMD